MRPIRWPAERMSISPEPPIFAMQSPPVTAASMGKNPTSCPTKALPMMQPMMIATASTSVCTDRALEIQQRDSHSGKYGGSQPSLHHAPDLADSAADAGRKNTTEIKNYCNHHQVGVLMNGHPKYLGQYPLAEKPGHHPGACHNHHTIAHVLQCAGGFLLLGAGSSVVFLFRPHQLAAIAGEGGDLFTKDIQAYCKEDTQNVGNHQGRHGDAVVDVLAVAGDLFIDSTHGKGPGCTAATHNGHDIGHQDLADAQAEEDHSNQNSQHRRADETTEDTREITRQGPRQDLTVNRHYRADNEQG